MSKTTDKLIAQAMRFSDFDAQARAILGAAPEGSGLADDAMGGYLYLDGGAMKACLNDESRRTASQDADSGAWDPVAGYYEGGDAPQARACLAAARIVRLADFPA